MDISVCNVNLKILLYLNSPLEEMSVNSQLESYKESNVKNIDIYKQYLRFYRQVFAL